MARKAKPAKIVDDDGYVTDGFFWRDTLPVSERIKDEKPSTKQEREQAHQYHDATWQDRLANIREWLTSIASPFWEGPFSFDEVDRIENENGKVRAVRIMPGMIVSTSEGRYLIRDEAATPEYVFAAINALTRVSLLKMTLEKHPQKLDWIVRDVFDLGQIIERVYVSSAIGPFALAGREAKLVRPAAAAAGRKSQAQQLAREHRLAADEAMKCAVKKSLPGDKRTTIKKQAAKLAGTSVSNLNRWLKLPK